MVSKNLNINKKTGQIYAVTGKIGSLSQATKASHQETLKNNIIQNRMIQSHTGGGKGDYVGSQSSKSVQGLYGKTAAMYNGFKTTPSQLGKKRIAVHKTIVIKQGGKSSKKTKRRCCKSKKFTKKRKSKSRKSKSRKCKRQSRRR
jgi:hypothetical protein